MKNIKMNTEVLQALEGTDYHVDSLGRIVIEDAKVMDMIKGAFSSGFSEVPGPLWNGACSNQHC
jgi:hypothetical protein